MALDERSILNIIGHELAQASGGKENDYIDSNRQAALASYLGQPDGKEVEGRSSIVSTDVADAIEWIMPEVVKAFTQNNEVVTFDPVGDGDEIQAELESQFVYDVLMKDNNGFLVIHQFVKDALMQKNGFVKVYYEKTPKVYTESYTGLNEIEYQMAISEKGIEVIQETIDNEGEIPLFDVKVRRTIEEGQEVIVCVPPEEFRANKMHNQIDLSTARFTAHVLVKTAGDLVAEGHDKEFVDSIPSANLYDDDRDYRFYMQGETTSVDRDSSHDPSLRIIEVAECYMRIDMDEDGIAELLKITVAGGDNPTTILDIEEIDRIPFVSITAILMSHKLFGLSIYDRLKQIQEQKTTLWRNIFDNMYLQNNQRTGVIDGQVNIDDLLVSRPGGIVRMKTRDAVVPLVTPPLSPDAYRMMDYLDQVRASRAGVSPEQTVSDIDVGDRVGSEGMERLMSQSEELVGLMVRVIAETGIKPICYMIRDDLVKHQEQGMKYNFRGGWVDVNPAEWRNRKRTTVRVGTGSGNRKQQKETLGFIAQQQMAMLAQPGQAIVTHDQFFNTMNDFAKASGFPSARLYFLDPESPEGQKNQQLVNQNMKEEKDKEDQVRQIQNEATNRISSAELGKAQATIKNVELKAENERMKNQLEAYKAQANNELQVLKQQLDEAKAAAETASDDADLQFKYHEVQKRYEVEMARIAQMGNDNADG